MIGAEKFSANKLCAGGILKLISLAAAITLTEWSERTFWRRFADGSVKRENNYGKSMVDLDSIKAHICIPLTDDNMDLITSADAGRTEAQNDLALLFLERDKPKSAIYWLELATKQDYTDAMHWLARCHIEGKGVPQNEDLGIMWLAKAAAAGHVISKEQISIMKSRFMGKLSTAIEY